MFYGPGPGPGSDVKLEHAIHDDSYLEGHESRLKRSNEPLICTVLDPNQNHMAPGLIALSAQQLQLRRPIFHGVWVHGSLLCEDRARPYIFWAITSSYTFTHDYRASATAF
jgi:hypothetical protein